jgi:hypothetical protein
MADNITIQKSPTLPAGMDYQLLRRTAMQYIQQLGSGLWTDYNIHDPGITIMELLCYALTDLSFRARFPLQDLLAEPPSVSPDPRRQGFFTAREILTISPWTTPDYRKLLIDIEGVKNGWLFCKDCACEDIYLYANCKKSILQYGKTEHKVIIKGLYDVLVEFEDKEGIGDLNSGKIKYNFAFPAGAAPDLPFAHATIEMRLPPWHDLELAKIKYKAFRGPASMVKSVKVLFISGNKGDNANILQQDLGSALRKPLFATLEISFWPDKDDPAFVQTLSMPDVPLLIWFRSDADRKALQLADLANALTDATAGGLVPAYLKRIQEADRVMLLTLRQLHEHRNLCEDYCTITGVQIQDVAICADMDVASDADIEQVLGQAYYLISQYMSPDIKFWSLKELLEKGRTVDEIFNGPQLDNGFIDDEQLAATNLKTELRTSDVINLLMDIPGVLAVRNFVFSPYDKEGRRLSPESWLYKVPYLHQPRLYMEASKVLVFKNGLPFLPDQLELSDTLQVIRGQNAQPKYPLAENDLPAPAGTYQPLNEYYPLQYDLPLTYGVGVYGLAPHVSEARKGKAKQLKAYLVFFEQMLVNYLATLSNTREFFALDDSISRTYFARVLGQAEIAGLNDIYATVDGDVLNDASMGKLMETRTEFLDRRNRFLDHMLARFAEQFTDYTLMLYAYTGNKERADETLIKDKIAFLKQYPEMSRNRGRSFNYKDPAFVCSSENAAGLQLRIARLLGFRGINDFWELYEEHDVDGKVFERRWRIRDGKGKILLSSSTKYYDAEFAAAEAKARKEIAEVVKYIADPSRYVIKKSKQWVLNLTDPTGEVIATRKQHFSKKTDAEAARDYLIEFAGTLLLGEKIFAVEHLLLRPHNRPGSIAAPAGDALLPVCIGPACDELCNKEDPYSFRMTLVMNGEGGLANAGIAFRRFAERTIRFEIPAHIGLKICWVSAAQLVEFEGLWCAYLSELAKPEPDAAQLSKRLSELLAVFNELKSIYPPASLHDCEDGNDENRVFLNQTVV